MPPNALSHSLPLPRAWPRRVRSAVVQVISLARTSLALTRGGASESVNGQLRSPEDGDHVWPVTLSLKKTWQPLSCLQLRLLASILPVSSTNTIGKIAPGKCRLPSRGVRSPLADASDKIA